MTTISWAIIVVVIFCIGFVVGSYLNHWMLMDIFKWRQQQRSTFKMGDQWVLMIPEDEYHKLRGLRHEVQLEKK